MIPIEEYGRIIEVLPILCVDVVVTNEEGQYLLVKRANEPRKGQWWVIGGRVLKGETLEQAAARKVKEEVSLDVGHLVPMGYYEAVSQANPFGGESRLHAVGVVFSASADGRAPIGLDSQSAEWKYAQHLPSDFHINFFTAGRHTAPSLMLRGG